MDNNFNPIAGKDTVYWDDSAFTSGEMSSNAWAGRSNPLAYLEGRKSSINGHKWGSNMNAVADNFGNNKVIDTWTYVSSDPFDAVVNLCMVIKGSVWNDINGNLIKSSSEPFVTGDSSAVAPVIVTEPLFINLIDENGIVISSVPVGADGKYTIKNVPGETDGLKIQLTTIQGVVGEVMPLTSLPEGWARVGELTGDQNTAVQTILKDAIIDLKSGKVPVNNGFDFAIQKVPVSDTATLTSSHNLGGEVSVSVPSDSFGGTDTDGGTVDSLTITSFPSNATSITIGEVTYTSSTFPEGGVTVPTNASGEPTVSISVDPISGDVTVKIPYKVVDNAGSSSSNTGSVSIPFHTYSISGTVFNDANGLSDDLVNGVAFTDDYKVVLKTADGTIVGEQPLSSDGTYTFTGLEGSEGYTVTVVAVEPSSSTWVNTGEVLGTTGSDGTVDGIVTIPALTGDVTNVNFGLQEPPQADDKYFTVSPSALSKDPVISGFENLSGYYSIPMNSTDLTGYPTLGSLSGSDFEDCRAEGSCHDDVTFAINSIADGTKLYYDFGGEIGIQEITILDGESITIENFDVNNMMIYTEAGQLEFGFTYSLIDNAGFASAPADYIIETGEVLSQTDLD